LAQGSAQGPGTFLVPPASSTSRAVACARMGAAECKGCSTSDPTSDTVKVNSTLLADVGGKAVAPTLEQQREELTEEQGLQREAEERQAREAAEEEERRHREAEEERRRREAEEQQQRLEREQAEERERIAREEQHRAECESQERAAAEAAERARQEEEERAHRAEQARLAAEAKEKVAIFLKARGFTKGIASAKKGCMKTSYPLHVAVEENSAEMVRALLKSGADRSAKNSSGLTPVALAQKLEKKKKGAYSAVLAALA